MQIRCHIYIRRYYIGGTMAQIDISPPPPPPWKGVAGEGGRDQMTSHIWRHTLTKKISCPKWGAERWWTRKFLVQNEAPVRDDNQENFHTKMKRQCAMMIKKISILKEAPVRDDGQENFFTETRRQCAMMVKKISIPKWGASARL